MPARRKDVFGLRFGRLVVTGDAPHGTNGRRRVFCHCDCGQTIDCDPRSLSSGHTNSCGCLQRDRVSAASSSRVVHGMARSPEYNSWLKMRSRCSNPSDPKFAIYGGRGIRVCGEWEGIRQLLEVKG